MLSQELEAFTITLLSTFFNPLLFVVTSLFYWALYDNIRSPQFLGIMWRMHKQSRKSGLGSKLMVHVHYIRVLMTCIYLEGSTPGIHYYICPVKNIVHQKPLNCIPIEFLLECISEGVPPPNETLLIVVFVQALNINDLHHVYEKLHESASPHWFNLGLALGLTYPVLTNISIASIMEIMYRACVKCWPSSWVHNM